MKKRFRNYYVCDKKDNGVWFSCKTKEEAMEYIEIAPIKCQEKSSRFYIRKEEY